MGGSGGSSPEIKYAEKLAAEFDLTYQGNVNVPSDDPVTIAIYSMGDSEEEMQAKMDAIPKDWMMHFTNKEGADIYIPQDIPDNFNFTPEEFLTALDDLPQFLKDAYPRDGIVLSTSTASTASPGEFNSLSGRLTIGGAIAKGGNAEDNYNHVILHESAHAFDGKTQENSFAPTLSESTAWKDAIGKDGYSSNYANTMSKFKRAPERAFHENFADAVANYYAKYGERNETPKGTFNAKEWRAAYPNQAALIAELAKGNYEFKR
jgi:hypothetical protein